MPKYVNWGAESRFEGLLDENGFRLDGFDPDRGKPKGPNQERGQRGVFISKKTGSPVLLT